MTSGLSHPALREWRRLFSRPMTWMVIAGVAILLTLVAPFESDRIMRPAPRAGYWFVMVVSTYGTGVVIALAALPLRQRMSRLPFLAMSAVLNGVAVTIVVALVNIVLLSYWPDLSEAPSLFATVFAIAAIVTLLFEAQQANTPQPEPDTPSILDRLPLEKRAPLVAISVEDHYVRVRTLKGEAVILMRLGDALRETGDTDGLQVHRSHWIAKAAVTSVRREGDRAILTMTTGPEIPVSRRYIPALKEAGLLPG